jgi:hypothetical protein
MPVLLSEARKNVQDALQLGVIDEFVKNNYLLEKLPFDPCVSATGGGATLTYAYTRLITQPTAQFRAVNSEYTPQEVTKQRYTADIAIFGGSYQIDRVIADMGGIVSEVQLQSEQKIKAAKALFNDTVINGDRAVDIKAFDGLDKAVAGSSTEFTPSAPVNLSSSAAVTSNYVAFLDLLDEFLMGLDGTPSVIFGNTKMIAKLRACARRAGMYQTTKTDFGNQVEQYGNIPWIDMGAKAGTNDPIVSTDADGITSLYAVRFGIDGFHAVSMAGVPIIKTWLPDYKTSGAVKTGEVEMNAAVVLKATKAAGVFRDIKVQ